MNQKNDIFSLQRSHTKQTMMLMAVNIVLDLLTILLITSDSYATGSFATVIMLRKMVFLLSALWFFTWLSRAYSNLSLLGTEGLRFTPFSAPVSFVGFIIGLTLLQTFQSAALPVLVLLFTVMVCSSLIPYFAIRELWRASNPEVSHDRPLDWKNKSVPLWISTWWAAFILPLVLAFSPAYLTLSIRIEAAALAILFIFKIEKRQSTKHERNLAAGFVPQPVEEIDQPVYAEKRDAMDEIRDPDLWYEMESEGEQ